MKDDNLRYWLWINKCLGPGAKLKVLLAKFSSVIDFYNAGVTGWTYAGISKSKVRFMSETELSAVDSIIDFCKAHKIHILTPDSEDYPQGLIEIEDFPAVLFLRGNRKVFSQKNLIAVIGSRTPCLYGEEAATEIVKCLAKEKTVIVSGGALGIDSIAHKTAIDEGTQTVLVLGHGFGHIYLPENSDLRKAVANNGALVTEYPPYTAVNRGSFPLRNRIISGVSKGALIVEAAEKSGTFSTANYVKKQGRALFVLPGDIKSGNFSGSNRLISEGARAVFCGEDILSYFNPDLYVIKIKGKEKNGKAFENIDTQSEHAKVKRSRKKASENAVAVQAETDTCEIKAEKEAEEILYKKEKINLETISENAALVYNIMSEGICEFDFIVAKSTLEIRKVLAALTELELEGIAVPDGPNKYRLNL